MKWQEKKLSHDNPKLSLVVSSRETQDQDCAKTLVHWEGGPHEKRFKNLNENIIITF